MSVVTVSARVALSLRAMGTVGEAWLTGLPGLLAGLATDWSITIGPRLDGGRTSYVVEATTDDGTPAVLKVSIPPGIGEITAVSATAFDRQLTALQLAGGDPYVKLIRHDVPRQALLLERLGRPMADLGWSAARQLDALTRTAARGWRRPDPQALDLGRLPTGTEAARWHAAFIPAAWEELAQPCSEAAVDLAVRYAAARETAFDPGRAVLVHGDVHAFNTLQTLRPTQPGEAQPDTAQPDAARADAAQADGARVDGGFRLVDPGGLRSEPAHDLGVIQARGVQGWLEELAASDPQQALERVTNSVRRASRITGTDPGAVWQWTFTELVSTGLHVLRLGDHEEAGTFLTLADKLATATATATATGIANGKPDHVRQSRTRQVTGEDQPTWPHHRPSPGLVAPAPTGPTTLFLMVGLPAAGKTTRATELAVEHGALRLTPDEWMISLFGEPKADGRRDALEGRLITVALQALHLGTNVVLDFGLWGRDERSALRWLAASAGASCQVLYLPVDPDVQRTRIAHRQATAPHTTFPMTEADLSRWRKQFQAPDAAELGDGETIPESPPGWPGWPEWATHRWPSLDPERPATTSTRRGDSRQRRDPRQGRDPRQK